MKLFDLSRFRFNKISECFSFDTFRQKIWKRLINPMVFLFLSEADCTQMYLFPTSKATVYHLTGKHTRSTTLLSHILSRRTFLTAIWLTPGPLHKSECGPSCSALRFLLGTKQFVYIHTVLLSGKARKPNIFSCVPKHVHIHVNFSTGTFFFITTIFSHIENVCCDKTTHSSEALTKIEMEGGHRRWQFPLWGSRPPRSR